MHLAFFLPFLALLITSPPVSHALPSSATMATWATALEVSFRGLVEDEAMCHSTFEQAVQGASRTATSLSGAALIQSVAAGLSSRFNEGRTVGKAIRDRVQAIASTGFPPITGSNSAKECCQVQPSELEYNWKFLRDVEMDAPCLRYPQGVSKSSGDVAPFNAFSDGLDATLRGLVAENRVVWSYFGHTSGAYKIYPGSNRSSCSDYDPRFRPWYVQAQTRPKNVILVIDTSGSMGSFSRMSRAREAALTVLRTLNPEDYVGVVSFQSSPKMAPGCFSQKLAVANPYNLQLLEEFVGNLTESGGTVYGEAFKAALALRDNSPQPSKSLFTAILFLTDGVPNDGGYLPWITNDPKKTTTIWFAFGLGFSPGSSEQQILNQIAAAGGTNTAVLIPDGTSVDLRTVMGSYYENANFLVGVSDNCTTTTPYFDASGLGLVLTVACPAYDGTQRLLGVAGVDITLEQVLEDLALVTAQRGWAILLDSTGRTYVHPKLASPTQVNQDPFLVHIDRLEQSSTFTTNILPSVLAGQTGSLQTTLIDFQSRGNAGEEGGQLVSVDVTYYWTPVANTDFMLVVVLPTSILPVYSAPQVTTHTYHRLDLDSQGQSVGADGRRGGVLTNAGAPNPVPGEKLSPSCYRQGYEYTYRDETLQNLTDYRNWANKAFDPLDVWSKKLTIPERIHGDLQLLHSITTCWNAASRRQDALYRYVGTESGIFFMTPASAYVSEYDPRQRAWYKRALLNPGALALSAPYIDAASNLKVITLSKAIYDGSRLFGVIGMDFELSRIRDIFTKDVVCPGDSSCFLMDDSGYLINAPNGDDSALSSSVWVGSHSATGASFASAQVALGGMLKQYCLDYSTLKRQSFYNVVLSLVSSSRSGTATCGGVQFEAIPVPNSVFYLVAMSRTSSSSNTCCGSPTAPCLSSPSATVCETPCLASLILSDACTSFEPGTAETTLVACPQKPPALRSNTNNATSGLSTGAIVGIAIGVAIGVALIVLVVVLLIRNRPVAAASVASPPPAADVAAYNNPPAGPEGPSPSAPSYDAVGL